MRFRSLQSKFKSHSKFSNRITLKQQHCPKSKNSKYPPNRHLHRLQRHLRITTDTNPNKNGHIIINNIAKMRQIGIAHNERRRAIVNQYALNWAAIIAGVSAINTKLLIDTSSYRRRKKCWPLGANVFLLCCRLATDYSVIRSRMGSCLMLSKFAVFFYSVVIELCAFTRNWCDWISRNRDYGSISKLYKLIKERFVATARGWSMSRAMF